MIIGLGRRGYMDRQRPTSDGDSGSRGRRRRDPEATKTNLLAAVLKLLERDGVLAGLNLREVAAVSGVYRGQIYQYFGSRRALLRSALVDMTRRWHEARIFHEDRSLPFAERRLMVFQEALKNTTFIKLEALLALDGDEQLSLFPWLAESRKDLACDKHAGNLAPDADEVVTHAATATIYLGYCVFRDVLARDLGLGVDELDRRMIPVVAAMIDGASKPRLRTDRWPS
jgi:AcrR family transcriptional regulator